MVIPELPAGTVTFLFTDIEGSTRLLGQYPTEYPIALAQHDEILRNCVVAHGGCVFETVGDAFYAAFERPSDAVGAALNLQRDMRAANWGAVGEIRVRVALHTGEVEVRGRHYFGPALYRCARLMAAGHGGQVLLSLVTAELVRDLLPATASLRYLGAHELKDLKRPEQVWQLVHQNLPSMFAPLKSLDLLATNLPMGLTSFVGRQETVIEIRRLLGASRKLLTLTGPGGVGKTRLAFEVATHALSEYADGAWLVELGALTNPTLVPHTVAAAVKLREVPTEPLLETLQQELRHRRLLLVLDNCEHLVEACAVLADTLLRTCPHIRILATSREALRVNGELVWSLSPLSLPEADQATRIEHLLDYEAIRLFVERATSAQPAFKLTDGNAPAVVQLCRRLDGLPLALELAAARLLVLGAEQIRERLDDRFRFLTGGGRTTAPRQQTLQAAFDWSYDLLNQREQLYFQRLAVFARGWSLDAAEAVCTGDGVEQRDSLDLLTRLAERSLVLAEPGHGGGMRYRLLESLRQYALERLEASGTAETIRQRHAAFFLAFALRAEKLLRGPEQVATLENLETEHDNLRAALEWSLDGGDVEIGVRLASILGRFWELRGHLSEGQQWLERALTRSAGMSYESQAKALGAAGHFSFLRGDDDKAWRLHQQSLALWREMGDMTGTVQPLNSLGLVALGRGDYAEAREFFDESVRISRIVGNRSSEALSLNNLGRTAIYEGDLGAARSLLQRSLALQQALGDRWGIGYTLNNLAEVLQEQNDNLGARALHEQSLEIWSEVKDSWGTAYALEDIAALVVDEQPDCAVRLLAAAASARKLVGIRPMPPREAMLKKVLSRCRQALNGEMYAHGWAEGSAMSVEQGLAYSGRVLASAPSEQRQGPISSGHLQ